MPASESYVSCCADRLMRCLGLSICVQRTARRFMTAETRLLKNQQSATLRFCCRLIDLDQVWTCTESRGIGCVIPYCMLQRVSRNLSLNFLTLYLYLDLWRHAQLIKPPPWLTPRPRAASPLPQRWHCAEKRERKKLTGEYGSPDVTDGEQRERRRLLKKFHMYA